MPTEVHNKGVYNLKLFFNDYFIVQKFKKRFMVFNLFL